MEGHGGGCLVVSRGIRRVHWGFGGRAHDSPRTTTLYRWPSGGPSDHSDFNRQSSVGRVVGNWILYLLSRTIWDVACGYGECSVPRIMAHTFRSERGSRCFCLWRGDGVGLLAMATALAANRRTLIGGCARSFVC